MPGGRQARSQSRRPQAARKTITPSHHHHHAHLRNSSTRAPPPRTPDHKKSERLRARHEIWAARKKLQLKKEKENESESLKASPVASLLLPEYQPKYVPMRIDWPDFDTIFDNFFFRIRRSYKPLLWPRYYSLKIVEHDSSCFDDSRSEEWLDALDNLFDEN